MKNIFIIPILLTCCISVSNPVVRLYTSIGIVEVEMYVKEAPITATNFLNYVNRKDYDGSTFYRTVHMNNQPDNLIKIEVIQGGLGFDDYLPNRTAPISHENTEITGIKHLDGTISMARLDTGTASSEFFICINDQPELDFGGNRNPDKQGFAAFGHVVSGMDIVHKIHQQSDTNQFYINPIRIDSIRLVN